MRGRLLRGGCGVKHDDKERGDGAEEQGKGEPEEAAAIFRLCEARIDQAQSSPADVIARIGERVKHAQIIARLAAWEDALSAALLRH